MSTPVSQEGGGGGGFIKMEFIQNQRTEGDIGNLYKQAGNRHE